MVSGTHVLIIWLATIFCTRQCHRHCSSNCQGHCWQHCLCQLPRTVIPHRNRTSDAGSQYTYGHTTPIHTLAFPIHTHKHRRIQLQHKICAFSHFSIWSSWTNANGSTDQCMDKASYGVACPQLGRYVTLVCGPTLLAVAAWHSIVTSFRIIPFLSSWRLTMAWKWW